MSDTIRDFRQVLGSFATGVTVVTTRASDDEPIGVTASSFNSVSLDPPLVLWSLAKASHSRAAFSDSGHFAVHVLGAHQQAISNRFAQSGADKFADLAWHDGQLGAPILDDYAALFECRTMHEYAGGDHTIFVGEVINFQHREAEPLIFHGGQYAEMREREATESEDGRFTGDFLLYLLDRAHFQAAEPARAVMRRNALSQDDYMIMSVLSMSGPMSVDALQKRLDHTGIAADSDTLGALVEHGRLSHDDDRLMLTEAGQSVFLEVLAATKAFESSLADRFSAGEIAEAKRFLRKLIALTG